MHPMNLGTACNPTPSQWAVGLPGLSAKLMGTAVASDLRACWACVLQVRNLSGGELQRVAITLALGTPADIYLIDEPSAYLDSEQRIIAAKVRAAGRLILAPAFVKCCVGLTFVAIPICHASNWKRRHLPVRHAIQV